MKKTLVSLSVAGALAITAGIPASYAQEEIECDGVLVQSRFALANCMLESAAAIAATVVTQDGCMEGEWQITASVPEWVEQTIPIQGSLTLSGNGDDLTLTGQSSAQLRNNVNCQVNTTDSLNTFGGREINYAAGSGNFYVDAIIDRDLHLLCITQAQSASNIEVEGGRLTYQETNNLTFEDEDGVIDAAGLLSISERRGRRDPQVLSVWQLEEEVTIPPLDETAIEGFEFEAYTNDLGNAVCEVEIEADVQNLEFPTTDTTGGLTVVGTLKIEVEEEEEE